MPSLWSGSITFGLVSIPVRLETSQRNKGLSFNMLHDKCQQRVNQKYYCSTCDQYLERHELVRGYEHEKDHYVIMDKGDFEKAEGEASRNIEIIAFVNRSEGHRPEKACCSCRPIGSSPAEGKEAKKETLIRC